MCNNNYYHAKILWVACIVMVDNSANNNIFLKEFESICVEKCIAFDYKKKSCLNPL